MNSQQPAHRTATTPACAPIHPNAPLHTQAHAKAAIPLDAHEYHIRRNLRDAAYQSLQVGGFAEGGLCAVICFGCRMWAVL